MKPLVLLTYLLVLVAVAAIQTPSFVTAVEPAINRKESAPHLTFEEYKNAYKNPIEYGIIKGLKASVIDARMKKAPLGDNTNSDSSEEQQPAVGNNQGGLGDENEEDDFPSHLIYTKRAESISPFIKNNIPFTKATTTPSTDGRDILAHLIAPLSVEDFISEFWENRPLLIRRNNSE